LASSGTNQIGFELRDHGEHIEQETPDRIVRVVYGSSNAELHVLRGELVDDVFRVSEGTREPVKLGDNQCVAASACSKGFPKSRSSSVGAGETMVGVKSRRV
jgi:hypothetical protein